MTVSPLFHRSVASAFMFTCFACDDGEPDAAAIAVRSFSSAESNTAQGASAAPKDRRCVIAHREGSSLSLQVFGIETLCLDDERLSRGPWHAIAREESVGRVVVSVDWPLTKTPACGSCSYDFKVELGPHAWLDQTELKFEVRACPSCAVDDSRSVSLGTLTDELATENCAAIEGRQT